MRREGALILFVLSGCLKFDAPAGRCPEGKRCDDGDVCTIEDTCDHNGVCAGTPRVCDQPSPARCDGLNVVSYGVAGTCDPETGDCNYTESVYACADYGSCVAGACVCTSNTCVRCGSDADCNTNTVCFADTCDGNGSCHHAPLTGAPCNDDNVCTTGDTCSAGHCASTGEIACAAGDQCHEQATCDPTTGCPPQVARPNGSACNDNATCTHSDACQGGACTGTGYCHNTITSWLADVPTDYPWGAEIAWASGLGFPGCPGGLGFCPDTSITRADFAVLVGLALNVPLDAPANFFIDDSLAPPAAVPFIDALGHRNCVSACSFDISADPPRPYFCPGATVSQAEAVNTITRCLGSAPVQGDCAGPEPVSRGVATCYLNRAACPGICP